MAIDARWQRAFGEALLFNISVQRAIWLDLLYSPTTVHQ